MVFLNVYFYMAINYLNQRSFHLTSSFLLTFMVIRALDPHYQHERNEIAKDREVVGISM